MHNFKIQKKKIHNEINWFHIFGGSLTINLFLATYIFQQKILIDKLIAELKFTNNKVNELNLQILDLQKLVGELKIANSKIESVNEQILDLQKSLVENSVTNITPELLSLPNQENLISFLLTVISSYIMYNKINSSLGFIHDWKNYLEYLPLGGYVKAFFTKQEIVDFLDSVYKYRLTLSDGSLDTIEIFDEDSQKYEYISDYILKLVRNSNDFETVANNPVIEVTPEALENATNALLNVF